MLKIIHVPTNNVGSRYFKLTTTCAQFQGQATLLQWGTGEICQKERNIRLSEKIYFWGVY